MSERARLALGPATNLMDTISWAEPSANPVTTGRGAELCFTRLWEAGGRVVVGVREAKVIQEQEGLLRAQVSLLQNYIRLEAFENDLSSRARARRHRATSRVRQVELERQRLATQLHTSVGQLLSAIRLQLEVVASQVTSPVPIVRQALDRLSTLSAEALEQVRSIAKRLHPPEWQRLTLESAIQQLWDLSGIPQHFESTLRIDAVGEPDLDAKVLLYRAAQEAVSNVTRHSRATTVAAALERRGDTIVLRVEDNGVGFDAAHLLAGPATLAAGIGLRTIAEQAEELGGTLQLQSGPGGTKLEVSVPLRPERQ
jgi:signal transduction histidine kinase